MATKFRPVEAGEVESFDSTLISYEVYGRSGPVILCCNGIACTSHAYWDYVVDEFAGRARIVLWDYRGHGRSAPPADRDAVGITAFRSDATAVMNALDIERATLMGHSMGVQVILDLYENDPERVDALIAVAGPAGRPLGSLYGTPLARVALPVLSALAHLGGGLTRMIWGAAFSTDIPFAIARLSLAVGPRAGGAAMKSYFDGLGDLDPLLLLEMFRAIDEHDASELLPSIDVPTLVVAGGIDTLTPVATARVMARRIPNSDLVVLPFVGHALPIEAPHALHDAVTSFLEGKVWQPTKAGDRKAEPAREA